MQTPCIHVCSIDPASGFCTGCGRTLDEIGGWMSYTDSERTRLMALLPARLFSANAMPCKDESCVGAERLS